MTGTTVTWLQWPCRRWHQEPSHWAKRSIIFRSRAALASIWSLWTVLHLLPGDISSPHKYREMLNVCVRRTN